MNKLNEHTKTNWIRYRESGITEKPWAPRTREQQTLYLDKYSQIYTALTAKSVASWLKSVPTEQYSKRKHMHASASSLARFLHSKKQLSGKELEAIKALHPRKPYGFKRNQHTITLLQYKQVLNYFSSCTSPHKALLLALATILRESGIRITEAISLKREHLHFGENGFIEIVAGKGGKGRKSVFTSKAQATIKAYWEMCSHKSKYVFMCHYPRKGLGLLDRSWVANEFREASKHLGYKFTAHSFRHLAITEWGKTMAITYVQKLAGHSNLEVTQRYLHIEDHEAIVAAYK